MTFLDILSSINAGGVVAVLVIILSLIEITPIKISPLSWIGKRVNKEVNEKIGKMEDGMKAFDVKIDTLDGKLNEHIAQSYRNKIFEFQEKLLDGCKSLEQFTECLEAIEKYETFCEENEVKNEKCKLAIDYIKRAYKQCQDNRDFT